jgi:hypothetical protein
MIIRRSSVLLLTALLTTIGAANPSSSSLNAECTVYGQIVRGGPASDVPGVVHIYGTHAGVGEAACVASNAASYEVVMAVWLQAVEDGQWRTKAEQTCREMAVGASVTPCSVVWGEDPDELHQLAPRRLVVDVDSPEDLDPYIIQSLR